MCNKRSKGRPAIKYNESEIYAIINHYRKNVQSQGQIKYLQLYRYHIELYKNHPEICSKVYSEDFWRKKGQPGRIAIDSVNKIKTINLLLDDNSNEKFIPNVVSVVDKYENNPEKLIKHLQPLENEISKSIKIEAELKERNEKLKNELKFKIKKEREMKEQIDNLKDTIFKLFHYSDQEGIPLDNLLDMNNKNKRIKKALEEAFDTPQNFCLEIYEYRKQVSSMENVVPLNKKKQTLLDEFEDKF